ncbi:hypothetical protein ACVWWI_003360 [Bradyrhizobium sp. USDA 3686]|uniref:hypothetical protein n=1 Tax=Bradyrhizobium TaxID=374 RepID=UPI001958A19A|nr:hypothetical protein [Bradyrhizobium canariense]MBM7483324.1 hypothetical protein [Bradyrhizobium canariense]UFW75505.1 hypothetical protein BcanWU425_17740 [Bradyrhizobium canariense]
MKKISSVFSMLFLEVAGGDVLALKRFMEREGFTHSTFERLASDGVSKLYRLSKPAESRPNKG